MPRAERVVSGWVLSGWSGGRNSYLAEWGEYEPCFGHTYSRRLRRPDDERWSTKPRPLLTLAVDVPVFRYRSRYRLTWRLRLSWMSIDVDVADGSARALRHVFPRVEGLLAKELEGAWARLAKKFYNRERAICCYSADGEGHPEPFATIFQLWSWSDIDLTGGTKFTSVGPSGRAEVELFASGSAAHHTAWGPMLPRWTVGEGGASS